MSYYHQKAALLIGFFLFVTSAYYQEYAAHRGDYYPFFSWSLFSIIPNPHTDFTIHIHEMRGETFDPPKRFSELRPLFETLGHSPTQYTTTIVALARASKADDTESFMRHLKRLNAIFGDKPFVYDVVEIQYDPIVFYRTGAFVDEKILFTINSRSL